MNWTRLRLWEDLYLWLIIRYKLLIIWSRVTPRIIIGASTILGSEDLDNLLVGVCIIVGVGVICGFLFFWSRGSFDGKDPGKGDAGVPKDKAGIPDIGVVRKAKKKVKETVEKKENESSGKKDSRFEERLEEFMGTGGANDKWSNILLGPEGPDIPSV